MNTATRAGAALLVVAALVWISVYAVEVGETGVAVYRAKELLNQPADRSPKSESWDRMGRQLARAEERTPSDPSVRELLGIFGDRSDPREYQSQASVHFVKALELRPSSAYTWANLAEVKYQLGDTGHDFETALVRASDLGPFEPEVQAIVARYGLAVWNEVSSGTRAAIEARVAAGMRRNPMEMLQIAERRGRLDIACRHLAGAPRLPDSKWTQLCQSVEATS